MAGSFSTTGFVFRNFRILNVQLQEEREESIIRNLKANIYNLLVEAGVAEKQAKELAKKTYKKVKKCIENNKEAEDTIDKMVDAAVDGIPTAKLDKLADEAVNEAVAELFDKNNKRE